MTNKPMPVKGYTSLSELPVALVNRNKQVEEFVLRHLDVMSEYDVDERWLAIARTQIEQGFMAANRAIFKPGRINLDDDEVGI